MRSSLSVQVSLHSLFQEAYDLKRESSGVSFRYVINLEAFTTCLWCLPSAALSSLPPHLILLHLASFLYD